MLFNFQLSYNLIIQQPAWVTPAWNINAHLPLLFTFIAHTHTHSHTTQFMYWFKVFESNIQSHMYTDSKCLKYISHTRTCVFVPEFQRLRTNGPYVRLERNEAARFEICKIATHISARTWLCSVCVYMEPREEAGSSETPYRHANFLRRTQAWPPMIVTRTTEPAVVVVNANDAGSGGGDHYRTAFATHSAVSVLSVNGTRVVFSSPLRLKCIAAKVSSAVRETGRREYSLGIVRVFSASIQFDLNTRRFRSLTRMLVRYDNNYNIINIII